MGQNSILLTFKKKKKKLKQNITNIISFCEFSYINTLLSMHMYGFFRSPHHCIKTLQTSNKMPNHIEAVNILLLGIQHQIIWHVIHEFAHILQIF